MDDPIPIEANILVTGNVLISGNVNFNSSIYVLGSSELLDAYIGGIGENGLVLLSKGKIKVSRFNEFDNVNGGYNPNDKTDNRVMEAFFYTDDEAILYGVGSTFWIHGGFFAKKNLTINAVRGNAEENVTGTDIDFDLQAQYANQPHMSRFVIEYNRDIFRTQGSGLPRVKVIGVELDKKKLE